MQKHNLIMNTETRADDVNLKGVSDTSGCSDIVPQTLRLEVQLKHGKVGDVNGEKMPCTCQVLRNLLGLLEIMQDRGCQMTNQE